MTYIFLLLNLCAVTFAQQQLRYSGRHYIDEQTVKFVWSSTGVSCRVQNTTTVSVNISIPHQGIRLRVKLNDTKWISTLDIPKNKHQKTPSQQIIVLVNNLDPKYSHTVQFMKVTEIDVNSNKHNNDLATSFHNFVLDRYSTFVAVPPFSNRRLEFIGDSDTAGYCVDGSPNGNDNQNKVQDSTETWAWQLASGLNVSDVQVEAISGWGVTSYSTPIQPYLSYADGTGKQYPADLSWIPNAIVILIGPNDYNYDTDTDTDTDTKGNVLKNSPSDQKFIKKYTELLEYAENRYGSASIQRDVPPPIVINVCGGSINGLAPCPNILTASNNWNKNTTRVVRSQYVTIGHKTWKTINKGTKKYNGCDSHYNKNGHGLLVGDIIEDVRKMLKW